MYIRPRESRAAVLQRHTFSYQNHIYVSLIQKIHYICSRWDKLRPLSLEYNKTQTARHCRKRKNQPDMDNQTLDFVTYCISKLSQVLHLPQREVYRRLKVSGILDGYIIPSYDVLHTFGSRYLMEDLTEYMKEKGVLA